MKRILLLFIPIILFSCNGEKKSEKKIDELVIQNSDTLAQKTGSRVNPYVQIDVSPMDMSYFPVDYPKLRMANQINTPPFARVIYSRPHLQGRHVFHEVLKYGEPWRLGANEATELELYSSATIQGKKIPAGRYTLYCIPQKDEWTVILNNKIHSWGLQQDSTKDVARFITPVIKTPNTLEYYTMVFTNTKSGATLLMAWDDVEVRLPITF